MLTAGIIAKITLNGGGRRNESIKKTIPKRPRQSSNVTMKSRGFLARTNIATGTLKNAENTTREGGEIIQTAANGIGKDGNGVRPMDITSTKERDIGRTHCLKCSKPIGAEH